MHPLGEWDEAVDLCDDALEYAETKEETADCLLLRVDALLGKGDVEEAKKCMARLPDPPFENGSYVFLIGRAYYELGETEKAAPFIEEAVRTDPTHADAYYYLGLLRDDAGDTRGAVEAFLRSRALDMTKPAPAWAPSPDAFAQLVRRVSSRARRAARPVVRDADIYIVDVPGAGSSSTASIRARWSSSTHAHRRRPRPPASATRPRCGRASSSTSATSNAAPARSPRSSELSWPRARDHRGLPRRTARRRPRAPAQRNEAARLEGTTMTATHFRRWRPERGRAAPRRGCSRSPRRARAAARRTPRARRVRSPRHPRARSGAGEIERVGSPPQRERRQPRADREVPSPGGTSLARRSTPPTARRSRSSPARRATRRCRCSRSTTPPARRSCSSAPKISTPARPARRRAPARRSSAASGSVTATRGSRTTSGRSGRSCSSCRTPATSSCATSRARPAPGRARSAG